MIKMKTIILTIFTSCSFTQFVDNSMNINSIPTSAESSAMGGIYIPFDFNEKIIFSHLSRFGGIYTLDALQYNNILLTIHGIDDIPNTTQSWVDIDNDGPDAHEINYSKISYFDAKDYNLILNKIIKNKYNIAFKNTISKIYNDFAYGLGLNVLTTKKTFKGINYYLGALDILSFKFWFSEKELDSNPFELYFPKIMISAERQFLQSSNVITLYSLYNNDNNQIIDYRLGSKIYLSDNLTLFLGKSTFSHFSFGFSIFNDFFNVDYSYIISDSKLPFDDSHNISIGLKVPELMNKSKNFYP